jgi:hypothetical protein
MSCYKCGTELPDCQVECEGGCPSAIAKDSAGQQVKITDYMVLALKVRPDGQKIAANEAEYIKAAERFHKMVMAAIATSGLSNFTKQD